MTNCLLKINFYFICSMNKWHLITDIYIFMTPSFVTFWLNHFPPSQRGVSHRGPFVDHTWKRFWSPSLCFWFWKHKSRGQLRNWNAREWWKCRGCFRWSRVAFLLRKWSMWWFEASSIRQSFQRSSKTFSLPSTLYLEWFLFLKDLDRPSWNVFSTKIVK